MSSGNRGSRSVIPLALALCWAFSGPLSAAETYEDRLLTTPATPEVLAKGLEADGYQLGVSVYTWGYPLVRMERVIRDYTDVPSPNPPPATGHP